MKEMVIDGRRIGPGNPPYVIAEVSGNHNKDLGKALKMIDLARECGADAVKFQTYTADSLAIPSDAPEFQITSGTWSGWNLYELYQEAATPYEWFPELFEHARKVGITLFSSPFDTEAVELLERFDAPAYKIASNELTDWPLIERSASTGKPLILSTGTATLDEIDETVQFLEEIGADDYALLHCISAYPAPIDSANLATMEALTKRYQVPVGLSDHTLGVTVSAAATALGASIIEKHFVYDRDDGGPDSSFALEPSELKQLCEVCRDTYSCLGAAVFGKKESEKVSPVYRKRFYSRKSIQEGEALSEANVVAIRAPHGIEAKNYRAVFGRNAKVEIPLHTPIELDMLT